MTGKQRILSTLKGQHHDRVPLWLMDSFANLEQPDSWTEDWMVADENFLSVRERYWNECEVFYEYKKLSPYGLCNRILSIPNSRMRIHEEYVRGNRKFIRYRIDAPAGQLFHTVAYDKHVATPWEIEHPLKSIEDAKVLMSIPIEETDDLDLSDFFELSERVGDTGVMMMLINTPMVTVSSSFSFEDYLVYSLTEQTLIEEMTEIAYARIERILEYCLNSGVGPIYRIMGSEQTTPPMGSLETYSRLVLRYEKKMIDSIHAHGQFAAVHCHGNVRQVLPLMREAGVDLLDPVEAPPSGDVAFDEAAHFAGNDMTLAGNIQYDDLESSNPETIAEQVAHLFDDGVKDHKIVSCTGYPITAISPRMRDNYHALIDAVFEFGTIE